MVVRVCVVVPMRIIGMNMPVLVSMRAIEAMGDVISLRREEEGLGCRGVFGSQAIAPGTMPRFNTL
jgi:hypothetical protein